MVATLHSTELDIDRCPRCGNRLADMTITDETIERMAIAICNYGKFHSHNAWLYAEPSERDRMRELARAALEAACLTVPSLPEEIAGLIERLRDAAEAEEICDKF